MKTNRVIRRTFLTLAASASLAGASLTAQLSDSSSGLSAQAAAQVGAMPGAPGAKSNTPDSTSFAPIGSSTFVSPTFDGDVVNTGRGSIRSSQAQATEGLLRMARLDVAAVSWAPASEGLVLPVGARVLLEYTLELPHRVAWEGATLIDLGNFSSTAEFTASDIGTQLVQIEADAVDGQTIALESVSIQVVDVADYVYLLAAGDIDADGNVTARPYLDDEQGGEESSLFGGLFGTFRPKGSASIVPGGSGSGPGGGGPLPPAPYCFTNPCTLTANASYMGNNTWRIYYTLCNVSKCDATYGLGISATTPSGKSWVVPSLGKMKLKKGACSQGGMGSQLYFDVELIDTDPNTEPAGPAYAQILITATGGSVVAFPGTTAPPTCVVLALSVCFGCPGT